MSSPVCGTPFDPSTGSGSFELGRGTTRLRAAPSEAEGRRAPLADCRARRPDGHPCAFCGIWASRPGFPGPGGAVSADPAARGSDSPAPRRRPRLRPRRARLTTSISEVTPLEVCRPASPSRPRPSLPPAASPRLDTLPKRADTGPEVSIEGDNPGVTSGQPLVNPPVAGGRPERPDRTRGL